MPEEKILKKEGVKIVKKRFKELLKPLGFRPYPHSTTRLVRVREDFIDELLLDPYGYHLDAIYRICLRAAPFALLTCDNGRLWRAVKEHISTYLNWYCEIPPEGGPYFYLPAHFEAVWRDVSYALEHAILPQMDAMTVDGFLSQLLTRSGNDGFFRPQDVVSLTAPYFRSAPETAVYGVFLWRFGQYEEGVPYLTFAQGKYRASVAGHEQSTEHFYLCQIKVLALLDGLLALWQDRGEGWEAQAQKLLNQVPADWIAYML